MKIIDLTLTQLKRVPRNKATLFFTMFFPLIFIGVFGIAFQQSFATNQPLDLAVIIQDEGIPTNSIVPSQNGVFTGTELQDQFLSILGDVQYEDNETNIFVITTHSINDEDKLLDKIYEGDLDGILYLPNDFSLGVMASFRNQFSNDITIESVTNNWEGYPSIDYTTDIKMKGDMSRQSFGITVSVMQQVIDAYFNLGVQDYSGNTFTVDGSISTQNLTAFDIVLPGLVIYGIMQGLLLVAQSSVADVESGLIRRLKITKVKGYEYTLSMVISQLIISVVQVPLFFAAATMFGFPVTKAILNAFVFALIVSLSMTGIGLIVASFGKDRDSVGSLSTIVQLPMAFLGGAFFEVPNPTLIAEGSFLGSNSFGFLDILPPTTAIKALRLVLIGGNSLADVWFYLLVGIVLAAIYLTIGVILFSKKHLSAE